MTITIELPERPNKILELLKQENCRISYVPLITLQDAINKKDLELVKFLLSAFNPGAELETEKDYEYIQHVFCTIFTSKELLDPILEYLYKERKLNVNDGNNFALSAILNYQDWTEWEDIEWDTISTVIKKLIEYGADVHYDNDEPLRFAIMEGDIDTTTWLVEHGADIHADIHGKPILLYTLGLDVLKYLIAQGCDIHGHEAELLFNFIEEPADPSCDFDAVKYIIEQSDDIDIRAIWRLIENAKDNKKYKIAQYLSDLAAKKEEMK